MDNLSFHTIDARRSIALSNTKEEAAKGFQKLFSEACDQAIEKNGRFTCALSGGSTPMILYKELFQHKLPWEKIYLFWGDERAVPHNDPESNYFNAMECGFKDMPLDKTHIFPIPTKPPLEKSAEKYEETLKTHLGPDGFDLVLLGMGDDGHTASLFPHTQALNETSRLFVANEVPQKNCFRLTLTYPGIHNSNHIIIAAFGKNKAAPLAEALKENVNKERLPIAGVGHQDNRALFLLDKASASFLDMI